MANEVGYKIVGCEKETFPKSKFIGICYKNKDRVDGMYGYYWGQFFENGKFEPIEQLQTKDYLESSPDAASYIGLMKCKNGANEDYFEYWIGMFVPEDASVPEGYQEVPINHDAIGVCFVKGTEDQVYCHEPECYDKLVKNGMEISGEEDGGCYMFERYQCPRFTTPDDNGEIILDIAYFVR